VGKLGDTFIAESFWLRDFEKKPETGTGTGTGKTINKPKSGPRLAKFEKFPLQIPPSTVQFTS
jgi:hypothetical protein